MGHLADAIAKSGFTDALQKKHGELETEHAELTGQLVALTSKGPSLQKLEVDLRKALGKMRANLESLSATLDSSHATEPHRGRVRAALEDFLGEIPLEPDYENGQLIATAGPKKEALHLLARRCTFWLRVHRRLRIEVVAGARFGKNLRHAVCLLVIPRAAALR